MGPTQRELCLNASIASNASDAPPRWFALTVKHQHERSAKAALESKQMGALVPLYRTRQQWSDRMQEIDLPLFAGYVLCRFPYADRARVLNTPGVRRIVGFGTTPTPVDDAEIAAIESMVRANAPIRPWPYLKPGDPVRVERGPLRGLTGTLIREKDVFRLVIGLELLQRSIAAEVSPDMIVPIPVSRIA